MLTPPRQKNAAPICPPAPKKQRLNTAPTDPNPVVARRLLVDSPDVPGQPLPPLFLYQAPVQQYLQPPVPPADLINQVIESNDTSSEVPTEAFSVNEDAESTTDSVRSSPSPF